MTKLKQLAVLSALFLTVALASSTARASQIFIQQSGTSAAGGDPNLISNPGAFVVGNAGNHTLQNPLLIIVAVYDGNGIPSISFSGCAIPAACPAATAGTYGLSGSTAGPYTAASKGDVFDQFGLTSGGSESFGNYSSADVAAGFAAPTDFTLYAFELPVGLGTTPITIDESGAAAGSFVLAYSCKSGSSTTSACASGDVAQTVMTNTGLLMSGPTHKVPEPSGLALLGSGLVVAAGLLRRKFASNR